MEEGILRERNKRKGNEARYTEAEKQRNGYRG
jgi:hypothetical protein